MSDAECARLVASFRYGLTIMRSPLGGELPRANAHGLLGWQVRSDLSRHLAGKHLLAQDVGVWGSRTRPRGVTCGSGCGLVLVDQASEDRLTPDPAVYGLGDGRLRAWWAELQRLMWPPCVVVRSVGREGRAASGLGTTRQQQS